MYLAAGVYVWLPFIPWYNPNLRFGQARIVKQMCYNSRLPNSFRPAGQGMAAGVVC